MIIDFISLNINIFLRCQMTKYTCLCKILYVLYYILLYSTIFNVYYITYIAQASKSSSNYIINNNIFKRFLIIFMKLCRRTYLRFKYKYISKNCFHNLSSQV